MQKIIRKEDLYKLLNSLLKEFEIIGPKEVPNKGIFYQPVTDACDLYLGPGFTVEPVKKFFLSPSEHLFEKCFKDSKEALKDIPLSEAKRIIIGVRPCEARGLILLDKVFNSDYKDRSYINNRNRTIIIGLACTKPERSCFCTSMEGSPVQTRGMDAILFGADSGFIVEAVTDKGKDIFASCGQDLSQDKIKSWESDKEKSVSSVKAKIKVAEPQDLDKIFESGYWSKVSQSCLSCGICTYLCPTCHCFDLVDEERKKLRCYDGCAFSDFTLEASGVNHRPTKKERYRQRVFHKFDYFNKNFGENLCVGCGRCIRHCPVKIDILEVVIDAPSIPKE